MGCTIVATFPNFVRMTSSMADLFICLFLRRFLSPQMCNLCGLLDFLLIGMGIDVDEDALGRFDSELVDSTERAW